MKKARLAADIGGTFTDIAIETNNNIHTSKVPTTTDAPELGVLDGIKLVLEETNLLPADFELVIHGTTLATNALIERKGANTAMLVTEGFRDTIEIAYENRFEQYDIQMEKPTPLVPREKRFSISERIDARGNILIPLEPDSVKKIVPLLRQEKVGSIAVCLMHSYLNPKHERQIAQILKDELPNVVVSLSSEISPEIREYERWSTTIANAYIQLLMSEYLVKLSKSLTTIGFQCPLALMTSGGGLTSLETALRLPVRLVESGPAGGAILSARLAKQCGFKDVLSFDMGGTTAKICLIDNGLPQHSRTFEVARQYRFLKGSGLPLRIPVIEMVEIGAGGGSIAEVDSLQRIQVGPRSAGSKPGPACYGSTGTFATVTDANLLIGRIDPNYFAGGSIPLEINLAEKSINKDIGIPLSMSSIDSACGITQVVEETMANAARVHAVEAGKELTGRTLIAFGGGAPLHANRLAQKLGINRIVIPAAAGVGSAVGFLQAPVAYEVARSRYLRIDDSFDPSILNALFSEMYDEAERIVASAARTGQLIEKRSADIRYCGQGHEITVTLPNGQYDQNAKHTITELFDQAYQSTYGRHIPKLQKEIISWSLHLSAQAKNPPICPAPPARKNSKPSELRNIFNENSGQKEEIPVYKRDTLAPGSFIRGPGIVAEDQTTTIILSGYNATVNALGYLVLEREDI